jgi:uncharacterized protein (UPF0335 family)
MSVTQLVDNTAARMLRNLLKLSADAYEERMLREVERMKEEARDLDDEIKEGMTNRNGDGFQTHEAPKYADRIEKLVYGEAVQSHEAIIAALAADKDSMLGVISRTKAMPLEQSELGIVKLAEPAPISTIDTA